MMGTRNKRYKMNRKGQADTELREGEEMDRVPKEDREFLMEERYKERSVNALV